MQGSNQHLPFPNNPSQIYKIVSVLNPAFCLDCCYDSETQGKLVIFSQHDGNNQRWRVMSDPQGNFGFMNLQNSGVLQIPLSAHGKEGSHCTVSKPQGGNNEKWRIVPCGKGYAIKSSMNPDLCLDICEEKVVNNNKIIVYEWGNGKTNQQWTFHPL